MYAAVRAAAPGCESETCSTFRRARDQLFRTHPDTPLEPTDRPTFGGLSYYPYDAPWRVLAVPEEDVPRESHAVQLAGDGRVEFTRVAEVHFTCPAGPATLNLYWIEGYGGGLFLPFGDATAGRGTYGGGRYLIDTIKGANLGLGGGRELILDFNYAYNPSCVYSPQWGCPLTPKENWLGFEVPVGERVFKGRDVARSDEMRRGA